MKISNLIQHNNNNNKKKKKKKKKKFGQKYKLHLTMPLKIVAAPKKISRGVRRCILGRRYI